MELKFKYIIAAIISISPLLLRIVFGNTLVAGTYSFYYALKYNISLNILPMLSIITSLASIYFFYLILKKFLKNSEAHLFTLLMIISIPFIYMANNFTLHNILFLIISIATYFYLDESPTKKYIGIILYLSMLFFPQGRIILLLIFFLLIMYSKGLIFTNYIVLILTAISVFLLDLSQIFTINQPALQVFISEFGSEIGTGASFLFLAIFGFFISWTQKKKFYPLYFTSILIAIFSIKYLYLMLYLNIFIVMFAFVAINSFIDRKYQIDIIKKLTIIVLILSFLYSAFVFADTFSKQGPLESHLDAFEIFQEVPYGKVLSHQSKSYWLEFYAKQEAFVDPLDVETIKTSNEIFDTKFLNNATALLDKNEIKYIFIDQEMKRGQVWNKPDQGLLFTLPNKEHFDRIYNKGEIEIYEVR